MLITLNTKTLLHAGGLILKPGANVIPSERWKEIRKHPSVAKRIENGKITEEQDLESVEAANPGGKNPAAEKEMDLDHLKKLNVKQANQLVSETIDLELLAAWKEREKRDGVIKAIDKQITAINESPEMRDRTQQRQVSTGSGPETVILDVVPGAQDE